MLCDERLYDLMAVLESLNARVSGPVSCGTTAGSPVIVRALNDGGEEGGGGGGLVVVRLNPPAPPSHHHYRRVGALIARLVPEAASTTNNDVIKWPDDQTRDPHAHPIANFHHIGTKL